MNPSTVYAKTAKAKQEIEQRSFDLPFEARAVLIIVDGIRTVDDYASKYAALGDIRAILADLEKNGFLEPVQHDAATTQAAPPPTAPAATPSAPASTDQLRAATLELRRLLKNSVGAEADQLLTNALENCATPEDLLAYAKDCASIISFMQNDKAAADFMAEVRELVRLAGDPNPS
jgi:hypothetical protein